MNSLFDPECHRQVLGNRQEAKEQKQRGRKEKGDRKEKGGGRRMGPARYRPGNVASTVKEVAPGLHRGQSSDFLPLPRLRASKQPDYYHLELHSLGP